MYLVELRPGKEELYRSGDDLAAAIRSGDVDGHSRIYHRATSKWISITLHPQYKAIVAERPAQPQPAVDRSNWTYLNAQSETLYVSRNRQLSTFSNAAIGTKVSWLWKKEPGKYEIKLNGAYEFVHFKFKDFTDLRSGDKYAYSASILQLYVTGTF